MQGYKRQCDNAKGIDVEFQKQGDLSDNANGMDAEFQKQGEYATTRQCEGDGWGVLEARRLCDNATMRRGWMGSFRSKET